MMMMMEEEATKDRWRLKGIQMATYREGPQTTFILYGREELERTSDEYSDEQEQV